MSQTIRIVEVNNIFYPMNLKTFRDHQEVFRILDDMLHDGILDYSEEYDVDTRWYKIEDEKSSISFLYSDAQLIEWYKLDGIKEIERNVKNDGYRLIYILNDHINISGSELDNIEYC